ncbi:hypothetical protein TSUD_370260 [Trifolium subterraneum]|uniref:F-box domain-containing protein n=1 Tax=Trifolium subterraneum TaxID=3900 RepID=A0A2Z6N3C7_TRISU|nr:hypothetical protein TSUD_370260 [Trifolium subterraneum]
MAADPSFRRLSSVEENDGIDRISNLPDSLRSHILSFLHTKTSVRMSLVSRKWRNFWKNLQVFDFSDKSSYILFDHDNGEQFLLFAVFVNVVLALRRSLDIRKFRLDCYHYQPDTFSTYSIETWISTAIVENKVGACLEIDAPNLKYLSLTNITFGDAAAVGNLHNVEKAYLEVFSTSNGEFVKPLLNLLRALSRIKHLELYSSTTKMDPSYDSSPSYGWATKPKCVPLCLVSHLTLIKFDRCLGSLNELDFTGYVLQNGLVLRTMLIDNFCRKQPEEWLKKISDLPRGSAVCQVNIC